jgi:signal transduction histidine kinase
MTLDPARYSADPAGFPSDADPGRRQWQRRRRLERRLHDGAALRISALTLQLGLFRHRIPDTEASLDSSIDELQNELHAVLQELREIAAALYPPLLDEAGLGPALREEAGRLGVRATISVPDARFGPAAEGAAYFAVAECLAGRPEDAEPLAVTVCREDDWLVVRVDGVDAGQAVHFRDGARPLGGSVETPGADVIVARLPCG